LKQQKGSTNLPRSGAALKRADLDAPMLMHSKDAQIRLGDETFATEPDGLFRERDFGNNFEDRLSRKLSAVFAVEHS